MGCCDGEGGDEKLIENGNGNHDGSGEQERYQAQEDPRDRDRNGISNSISNSNTSASKTIFVETPTPVTPISRTISQSLSPFEFESESDQWTQCLPSTEHVSLFKNTNWAATPLGPLSQWNVTLRMYTCNVIADSQAAILYMGPQKVSIYNEAFIPLAGKLHPTGLMGVPFGVAFAEIDEPMAPVFSLAETSGRAADVNEMEMFVERNKFVEETHFTGNFNPLRGPTGKVEGFYNTVHEITKITINERRRTMLDLLEAPPNGDMQNISNYIIPCLKTNPRDVPMALLYKVDEDVETTPGNFSLSLHGSIGIPEGHPLATQNLDLSSTEGLAPYLRKSKSKMTTIPANEHFAGVDWKGFGEASNKIEILPIIGLEDRLFGFLVLGTNPRRPIDEYHNQFLRDISSKTASIFAAVISAEETRSRAERLERHLADSMKQIRYMAENASVGMAYVSPDGVIRWSNPQFYRITGHTREEDLQDVVSFLDVFADEDREVAADVWKRLLAGELNLSIEVRLKRMYQPPLGDAEQARVLCHSSARLEDGQVKSVMTIITDVSAFRWAEETESRKATQAEAAKRLQEDFIDFVSHELRNPLSAIFQLAETIVTSFPANHQDNSVSSTALIEALRSNIDNASTIIMCAEHQKRIVDDVLTLSKLDYTMLSVSPRPIKLPGLVERWLTMFETQLASQKIKLTVIPHPSISEKDNNWILCDESRVQQIFLNLMTNAIKFTKNEKVRELTIEYAAVPSVPKETFSSQIIWAPNQRDLQDLTLAPAWGFGRPVYLTFAVKDTGIGMTGSEIQRLFGRFEQANARTTIKYGGSGLGLFLSQRLAERQGGAIGVMSEKGKGSTFAFYVKSRRAEEGATPADPPFPPPLPRSLSQTSNPSGVDLSKLHILLVEDNIVNQKVVQRQLVKAGCVVHVANQGVEALEILRTTDIWHESNKDSHPLDVILMDWEMPIMDGLACSREIRALQKAGKVTRHIEIIATTANAREEQMQTALASGCDCVVSKPFLVKDLLVKIRERLHFGATRFSTPQVSTDPF